MSCSEIALARINACLQTLIETFRFFASIDTVYFSAHNSLFCRESLSKDATDEENNDYDGNPGGRTYLLHAELGR